MFEVKWYALYSWWKFYIEKIQCTFLVKTFKKIIIKVYFPSSGNAGGISTKVSNKSCKSTICCVPFIAIHNQYNLPGENKYRSNKKYSKVCLQMTWKYKRSMIKMSWNKKKSER